MPVDMTAFKQASVQLDSNEPPPPGLYNVRVEDCHIFDSQAGDTYLKMGYSITGEKHRGHMWTQLHGFKTSQLDFTKSHLKMLGVDVHVASQDEIEQQLEDIIGKHYTVEVVQRGQYTNTNVKGAASAPVPPPDIPAPASNGQDKIPF
jgi:hypothetical protein